MARQWLRAGLWGAAIGLLATAGLAWLATPVKAQQWVTVATCGTPPRTPAVGTAPLVTVDQTGVLCSSSSGGGGGSLTPVMSASVLSTGTGWDTSTPGDSTQTVMSTYNAPTVLLSLVQGAGISAGAVTFEGTYDAVPNWSAIPDTQLLNPNTFAAAGTTSGVYTLQSATNKPFLILTQGYRQIRIRLSTTITGAATVTPYITNLNYDPTLTAVRSPISGITPVSIDQTTPGTTNAVTGVPNAASGAALTQNACGSAVSSCVLKASAGNFYGAYANCTAACWMMVFNSTSAPSNGATTAGFAANNMVDCVAIPANDQRGVSYPVIPIAMSTGITVAISNTACATLTLATTGFIHGTVK